MWELDCKESWALKNWCFWTVVLEKKLRVSWTARISTLNIHWKDWCWSWSWSSNTLATWCEELTHWKRPWCGKDWRKEEKRTTKDEMGGCHQWHAAVHQVAKSRTRLNDWMNKWRLRQKNLPHCPRQVIRRQSQATKPVGPQSLAIILPLKEITECREPKAGALWQPRRVEWGGRWEGSLRVRGCLHIYTWFMLMYGRNHHNIVK